jgi:hypothetical protein
MHPQHNGPGIDEMLSLTRPTLHWICLSSLLLVSCKGKDGDSAAAPGDDVCGKPVANAGTSRALPLGSLVTADGSASTWCEKHALEDISYVWTFETVPADSAIAEDSLSDNRTSTAFQVEFVPDVPGEYVLSLRVNDPDNASEPDYVVNTVTSDDLAPTADCGGDHAVLAGQAAVLDGSDSADPEGAALTYNWAVASIPGCSSLKPESLFDRSTTTPSIIPDCAGVFVVSLVVNDGLHDSDPDFCTIDAESNNQTPVASAGDSGIISTCTDNPFQLNGWGSYDPDGDALSYQWSVGIAPEGADSAVYGFGDAEVPAPYFTWDVTGEWTFLLQVSDGTIFSAPDSVIYTINGTGENNAPSANAGGNVTVSTTAPCTRDSSYVWTCEPCETLDVELDGSASGDPDDDFLQFQWTEDTGELNFSSTSTAITTVTFPPVDAEYGVTQSSSFEVQLHVEDCSLSDNDRITVTYECTGEYDSGF